MRRVIYSAIRDAYNNRCRQRATSSPCKKYFARIIGATVRRLLRRIHLSMRVGVRCKQLHHQIKYILPDDFETI